MSTLDTKEMFLLAQDMTYRSLGKSSQLLFCPRRYFNQYFFSSILWEDVGEDKGDWWLGGGGGRGGGHLSPGPPELQLVDSLKLVVVFSALFVFVFSTLFVVVFSSLFMVCSLLWSVESRTNRRKYPIGYTIINCLF